MSSASTVPTSARTVSALTGSGGRYFVAAGYSGALTPTGRNAGNTKVLNNFRCPGSSALAKSSRPTRMN